jgi:cellulose synthase/poly-beta-1,6-N-acetylglucosamine synthase-like glycosyltransferase
LDFTIRHSDFVISTPCQPEIAARGGFAHTAIMPADEPSVLLLIPAYNEAARIGPVLRRYAEHFQANYRGHFQIVVVMNGCRDNTKAVVEAVARDYEFISALDFPDPIGKGGALIEGLRLAALTARRPRRRTSG